MALLYAPVCRSRFHPLLKVKKRTEFYCLQQSIIFILSTFNVCEECICKIIYRKQLFIAMMLLHSTVLLTISVRNKSQLLPSLTIVSLIKWSKAITTMPSSSTWLAFWSHAKREGIFSQVSSDSILHHFYVTISCILIHLLLLNYTIWFYFTVCHMSFFPPFTSLFCILIFNCLCVCFMFFNLHFLSRLPYFNCLFFISLFHIFTFKFHLFICIFFSKNTSNDYIIWNYLSFQMERC